MSVGISASDVFLPPGGLWFGAAPQRVRTLLGSCVAMTVWHPGARIGGMCHYMLPARPCKPTGDSVDGRYGEEAMTWLLQRMQAVQADRATWQVKLFGGGAMFPSPAVSTDLSYLQVQRRNVDRARLFASRNGLEVRAHDLGGAGHRSLVFDLASGDVWLKHTPLAPDARTPSERQAA